MTDLTSPHSNKHDVWRCAVPTPLRRLFDYLPPQQWQGQPTPGLRVRVPFGRRKLTAVLVSVEGEPSVECAQLRRVDAVLDQTPLLDGSLLELLLWTASYYQHPPGEVLPLGLSPGERRGKAAKPTWDEGYRLTLKGEGLSEHTPHRAPKQAALISRLRGGQASVEVLQQEGYTRAVMRALIDKALIEPCPLPRDINWRVRDALPATAEQTLAIKAIQSSLGAFATHLLYGVTGSGKTEVYLQAIASCLEARRQALVLLPEISLTPQTLARFEARFDAPVLVMHSAMGDAERDRVWAAAREGQAAVVLGTRSAVFTPLKTPGLIVVDEEHDAAFVQQDGLRYSARDVAIKRGQLVGCPVVLGSATPSLESWHNAEQGRYVRHTLTERAGASALPKHQVLDISGLALSAGLAPPAIEAIERTLSAGQQVLVFLNRRGFAHALMCHDCGWSSECSACDARMTLHKQPPELHCHHCGHRRGVPRICPHCSSARLLGNGVGTQQTEAFLTERFPDVPVLRVDSDTMSGRRALPELIAQLNTGKPALIIGTQMLSKGHHFPAVTLVAVVDADALLFSPDFRGEERLLQMLTQVGGRAGRERLPGQVLIQTRHPHHPLIEGLSQPYHLQVGTLLEQRRRSGLPPIGALGAVRCDSTRLEQGMAFLQRVRGTESLAGVQIIGPLPAAMARRKNRYRCQLVIAAANRRALAHTMGTLIERAESDRRSSALSWSVDIDPYESL